MLARSDVRKTEEVPESGIKMTKDVYTCFGRFPSLSG